MFCKECGTQFEGRFCPNCGDSVEGQRASEPISPTPTYAPPPAKKNKGCLIAIVVIVVIMFFFMMVGTDDGADTDAGNGAGSSSASTTCELFVSLEENGVIPFTVTEKAKEFLSNNEELFSTDDFDLVSNFIDYNLEYKHLAKNVSNYGDNLMNIYGDVVQIEEFDWGDTLFTSINLSDEMGNQYYVFYKGTLDNVFEGDTLDIYGLPLDMSSFDNTEGGQTLTPVLAGSYVDHAYI